MTSLMFSRERLLEPIKALAVLCSVFAVFDAVSTWIFLHFGTGVEGNILAAQAMNRWGVIPVLIGGTVLRFGAMFGLVRVATRWPRAAFAVVIGATLWWGFVVYHNYTGGIFPS